MGARQSPKLEGLDQNQGLLLGALNDSFLALLLALWKVVWFTYALVYVIQGRRMKTKLKAYPTQVCFDCGKQYMRPGFKIGCPTVHDDVCQVCGAVIGVTEPRDFGYPVFPGFEKP